MPAPPSPRRLSDKRLLRHLVIAVVVKLIVLTGLWWACIRDARVHVDTDQAAAHIGTPASKGGKQ